MTIGVDTDTRTLWSTSAWIDCHRAASTYRTMSAASTTSVPGVAGLTIKNDTLVVWLNLSLECYCRCRLLGKRQRAKDGCASRKGPGKCRELGLGLTSCTPTVFYCLTHSWSLVDSSPYVSLYLEVHKGIRILESHATILFKPTRKGAFELFQQQQLNDSIAIEDTFCLQL